MPLSLEQAQRMLAMVSSSRSSGTGALAMSHGPEATRSSSRLGSLSQETYNAMVDHLTLEGVPQHAFAAPRLPLECLLTGVTLCC